MMPPRPPSPGPPRPEPRTRPDVITPTPSDSLLHTADSQAFKSQAFSSASSNEDEEDSKIPRSAYEQLLEDHVPFFGEILIDKTAARVWAQHSLRMLGRQHLIRSLDKLLRYHGLEIDTPISSSSHPGTRGGTAKRIDAFRLMISRYFWRNALPEPSNISALEKADDDHKGDRKGKEEEEDDDDDDDGDDDDEEQKGNRAKRKIQQIFAQKLWDENYLNLALELAKYLFMTPALYDLVMATRKALYVDDPFKIEEIRSQIELNLPADRAAFAVEFELDWKPFEFFESQFECHIPQIGSLVTLTGSVLYAQATTCKDYLERTWPDTWEPLLSVLQSVIDTKATESTGSRIDFRKDNSISSRIMPDETLSVLVLGERKTIIDVAQQISWVSAALGLSPFEQKVAYCNTSLVYVPDDTGVQRFKIERVFALPQSIEESCWLSLFSNAALVRGFPIPVRGGESGLEISIDLMAAIAGIRHAVEYNGGVVMKGFSSMLIPARRDRETDTVQWHLVSSHEETRLSYEDGIARCSDRALLEELDLQLLQTTRAILGWCSTVETVLGREDINYENIDYSTAPDVTKPIKIQHVAVGFQQFGMGQMEFTLGPKDGTCHFQRQGPYRRIIDAAEITPIVLFDTGERRGWLVPASGVLLHIARHRNWLDQYISKEKGSFKQGTSFREELLQNESMVLFDDESYKFKDMITEIWSILEFLLDQRISASNGPGLVVKSPFQDTLQGYEFKAVVESRSPLKAKQCVVEKTSGGWPLLVGDIDALVLFASGFEDLIRPAQGNYGLCHKWKTVPKGKDYLATTVKMLKNLYDVAGCRLSKQYLTSSRLQWHRGDSALFEACHNTNSWQCKCSRLQQIVSRRLLNEVVPPGPLEDEGGIIFGRLGTLLAERQRPAFSAPRETGIYS
ncbi:hypothetical protein F4823DRAFT_414976 [Ustulina deusta]|nr:hypothetical protein F4823DRAFT_414976 [Ustulina deusta]